MPGSCGMKGCMETNSDVILIVDDNEMNRDMLSRRLNRKGYECIVASDGEEALAILEREQGIDLVLLDIMMPKMNGIEVLQVVRQTRSMLELPVIMVSAKIQSADIVKALELEANDYVTKPIDFPVCLARIRTQMSRKRAEEALQRSESRNRAMIQAIPDVLLRLNQDGRLLDSRNAQTLEWELSPEAEASQDWIQQLPDDIQQQCLEAISMALEHKTMQSLEFMDTREGHEVDYEARLVPSSDDQLLMLIRDISERKALQRLRHEFMLLLQVDLQDSLGSIRNLLRMISQHPNLSIPGELKALLSIAHNKSNNLFFLIDDLLNIHRLESGFAELNREEVNVQDVVQSAIESLVSKGVSGPFRLLGNNPSQTLTVHTDKKMLQQIVLHLLQNALSYSPKGETVDVQIEQRGDKLRVAVTDRGPQIPHAFQNRVFHKFGRAGQRAENQNDSGLNLSLSKAMVETLGGFIGIEPGEPVGNTFFVDLPSSQTSSAAAQAPVPQAVS